MRRLAEEARIRAFMREIGQAAREEARVYFTGGASAVLQGWRDRTIDVLIVPDRDELLRRAVEEGIKNQIFVSCNCEVVCHGELPRSERKTKRVFDKRD